MKDIRLHFVRFLNHKVARTEPGLVSPRWIRRIRNTLYPLKYLYERQSKVRYDFADDSYTLNGVEISRRQLENLRKSQTSGYPFAYNDPEVKEIMSALGIDHSKVKSFVLRVDTGEAVKVEVEYFADLDKVRSGSLPGILQKFQLTRIPGYAYNDPD